MDIAMELVGLVVKVFVVGEEIVPSACVLGNSLVTRVIGATTIRLAPQWDANGAVLADLEILS